MFVPVLLPSAASERGRDDNLSLALPRQSLLLASGFDSNQTHATMGRQRTAWHLLAATFIDERRPRAIELETEVQLSKGPQQADMLLLRRGDGPVDDA